MKVSSVDAQARLSFAAIKSKHNNEPSAPQTTVNSPANTPAGPVTPINFASTHRMSKSSTLISFGSADKIKGQTLFVGAEMPPYCKVGGVATVMQDYAKVFKGPMVIPYYNGAIEYDKQGDATGNVSVLKKDGKTIYTGQDLTKVSVNELQPGQFFELEEVAKKTMQWAENDADEINLYKVKGTEHYMVYTDATAKMPKPYQNAGGGYAYGSDGSVIKSSQGDAYAKFNKALVEMLPDMKKGGVNPEHILLSDSQSANVFEYVQEKALKGDEYFKEAKASYIMHNIGSGYQGETSATNMFYNFATKEQIDLVKQDPHYIKAKQEGSTENYFKQFVTAAIDEKGSTNASMVPIHYAKQGIANLDAVSEIYAESAAKNPLVAKGLTGHLNEGYDKGWFGGILNGFDDDSFNPEKPIGMTFYKEKYERNVVDKDGNPIKGTDDKALKEMVEIHDETTGITHKPFELWKKDAPLGEIINKKQLNAKNMFQRLYKGANPDYAMGMAGKGKLIGHIDKKWTEQIDKFIAGDKSAKVNVFSSWGRGDFQKGLDIVLDAFIAHTKTDEGKNSVLIFGGEIPENSEGEKFRAKLDKALAQGMEGRVVYMDGFAPNKPLAAISDSCLFTSRFEPCGLTDFEAMLHGGASPIVVGTQGLAQKNFNPGEKIIDGVDKTTGYKTEHEFYMSHDDMNKITKENLVKVSEPYKNAYEKMVKEEEKFLTIIGTTFPVDFENRKDKTTKKCNTVRELAEERVKGKEKYSELQRKWADDILAAEVSEALNAKSKQLQTKEGTELYERQLRNSLEVKTGWKDNNAAHPSQKSSFELYQERHFNGGKTFKEAKTRLFDFTQTKMDEIRKRISEANIKPEPPKPAINKGKVAAIAGGAAVLGGLVAYFAKSQKPANANVNADGDAFQRTSPSKNNNKAQNRKVSAANKRNQAERQQQLQRA